MRTVSLFGCGGFFVSFFFLMEMSLVDAYSH